MPNINSFVCRGRLVFPLPRFWVKRRLSGLLLQTCQVLVFPFLLAFGTVQPTSAADTTRVLTLSDFYHQIRTNHPVAKQADLLPQQARQEIRTARGNFDPELTSYFAQKQFDNKEYYQNWNSMVTVPLWFGADLRGGYEQNTGPFVNPEKQTPTSGLSYAGISIPVGQGWLIDQRRTTLRQAQALASAAEGEKVKTINKLLLDAAKEYWDWAFAYQRMQLYQNAYNLARVRYLGVTERAKYGDLAAIDTVEALFEVNNRALLLQQARTDYQNGRLLVSNYLWTSEQAPVELVPNAVPVLTEADLASFTPQQLQELLSQAQQNHPELQKLTAKYRHLDLERKLSADKFKPKLNLEYNFLRRDFGFPNENLSGNFLQNNYKAGVSFSYPLLLRSERGKLQVTKLKILDTELALTQTQREINTSVQTAYNDLLLLSRQMQMQEQLVSQAELLRNGEQTRFENGESSVFMVNTREMNLINQQLKLWELKVKYARSQAYLFWAAGSLNTR